MRRPRTTAAAFATLVLLACAWVLLALGTASVATSGPDATGAPQFEQLPSELPPCSVGSRSD